VVGLNGIIVNTNPQIKAITVKSFRNNGADEIPSQMAFKKSEI